MVLTLWPNTHLVVASGLLLLPPAQNTKALYPSLVTCSLV